MSLSPDVAAFLTELLDMVTLSVGADDFAEKAAVVVKAKTELHAVIAPAAEPDPAT